MSKEKVSHGPRRVTPKEVSKRKDDVPEKETSKSVAVKVTDDVHAILMDKHPKNGEDYAIQIWYKTYRNSFLKVTSKKLEDDKETAKLTISGKNYIVNIRTGKACQE